MKICHFCRAHILESGSTWGKHQDSYQGYQASAQEACVFCTRIVAVLDDYRWQPVLVQRRLLEPERAVYRWTLQKAAKIREMPDSFVVTFREIPYARGTEVEEQESLAGMPDLFFYVLREEGA